MSLEFAILGFLNYKPFTGYELKKMFDTSVRHFWSADQSQIYRTLAKLTADGLAEVEVVEQTTRPDRKLYHITSAGQARFVDWLRGPFPNEEARSGPLVQVFFSARLTDDEILVKFETAAEIFRTLLERYASVPPQAQEAMQQVPSPREHYFWMQTLDLGNRTMRAQLDWAEAVIADLKSRRVPEK